MNDDIEMPRLDKLYRLQFEEAQKAWVLLYPEGMVKLNDSAGAILQRCDGAHTVAMMVEELQQAFGIEGIAPEVETFVKHAIERGWLV
ncbi:pyrroloquinoline quinone biosynthesis peptide chaperone PqqD [Cupriavidus pampae]|uniref:PqqA binding protein n=1 Tax=Cupriavidus pampae TaxID=659251 RepID=A0ABN7XUC3_9BURK|nr:pyrroloquinoline quinone biosynthesis peptide chaperone PqqD [Cupriavidus pampae]CAG9164308.1 PqqA binding protein [Cupriavidus pampae]